MRKETWGSFFFFGLSHCFLSLILLFFSLLHSSLFLLVSLSASLHSYLCLSLSLFYVLPQFLGAVVSDRKDTTEGSLGDYVPRIRRGKHTQTGVSLELCDTHRRQAYHQAAASLQLPRSLTSVRLVPCNSDISIVFRFDFSQTMHSASVKVHLKSDFLSVSRQCQGSSELNNPTDSVMMIVALQPYDTWVWKGCLVFCFGSYEVCCYLMRPILNLIPCKRNAMTKGAKVFIIALRMKSVLDTNLPVFFFQDIQADLLPN